MLENRTMPDELSSSAMTVTASGLKCVRRNILVKSILAIRGHQMTLQYASPTSLGFVPSPCRDWALPSRATAQKILLSYLLYLSVLHSTAHVLVPKLNRVAGKFSELSHFWVEDAQPPSGQGNTGKILFTHVSSLVRHIAFGNGSYTVQTAINLWGLKGMTGNVTY